MPSNIVSFHEGRAGVKDRFFDLDEGVIETRNGDKFSVIGTINGLDYIDYKKASLLGRPIEINDNLGTPDIISPDNVKITVKDDGDGVFDRNRDTVQVTLTGRISGKVIETVYDFNPLTHSFVKHTD